MKAILMLLLGLLLVQKASANEAYDEFFQDLRNYVRTFSSIASGSTIDSSARVEMVRQAGARIQDSWAKAKPYVDKANPQLSQYLNERANFLVLATYMVQYDPEFDKDIPVFDESGTELSNSYTDEWRSDYIAAYERTPKRYIEELAIRLQTKYPEAEFKINNSLLYSDSVLFLADAISLSALEAVQATIGEPVLQQQIDSILNGDPEVN